MKTIKIGAIVPNPTRKHLAIGKLQKPNLGKSLKDALTKFVTDRFPKGELGLVWDKANARYNMILKVVGEQCLEAATAFEKDHKEFAERLFLIEESDGSVRVTEYGEVHKTVGVMYRPDPDAPVLPTTALAVAPTVTPAPEPTLPSAAEGELDALLAANPSA